ncbi:DUF6682 family protein [Lonepinella koalarum]|uniref:Uncharacterized protein n=1 Tax=Lonepinella koalarum TaxID=53417 RepID=A0A4R1L1J6_9PAST|nr:DUF6682 family protein [Lonepinella koalarum]MDH2927903.1 hypothetical protein [Lonepinella koalarum]TCK70099.1 hypothetical protein EV692_1325 [Lonepinella koalarum]TFJ90305.1 hypothetical protein E0709_02900 [Lonepinella koalarum]
MNIADFILRVRFDYNDIDADRIEDPLIVDYLNEAVAEMFKLNPAKFIKTVVTRLDESDLQQPCCCDLLYSVDAITDAHGNFIAELKEVDDTAQTAFGKRNCANRQSDTRSYSKVNGTDNQFSVKPPVSPDENIYARMTCAVKPDKVKLGDTLDENITENYANLVDYVLYRLFAMETESATSQQKSAQYYKQFLDRTLLQEQVRVAFTQQANAQASKNTGGKK